MKLQFISVDFFFYHFKTNIILLLRLTQIATTILGDKVLNKVGHIAKGAKASSGVSTIANAVKLAKELKPTLEMLQSFKRDASYAFSSVGGTIVTKIPQGELIEAYYKFAKSKGYFQDASGRWHRPGGGYASNKEVGLPVPSGSTKRLKYMGSTPSKDSRTGKAVIERMKNEDPPKIRTVRGKTEFLDTNNKWRPLSEADMAHKTDAVTWWNEVGRNYGPRSKEVRDWMLDPDNYYLEHYSKNRSEGASLGQTYVPPK